MKLSMTFAKAGLLIVETLCYERIFARHKYLCGSISQQSTSGEEIEPNSSAHCLICDIVLAELRYGAYNSDYVEDNLKMIEEFIKEVKVLPLIDSIDTYAKEKVRLRKLGQPIEDFDLLIGCAAKAAGLTAVTHNVKHFSHIEGLEIEDWIK